MYLLFWVGNAVALIYGILTVVGGAYQVKSRDIPTWSAVVASVLGVVIIFSTFVILINLKIIFVLILCFLLLHIIAIVNGVSLNGRINYKHHFIRFLFSIFIIVSLIM